MSECEASASKATYSAPLNLEEEEQKAHDEQNLVSSESDSVISLDEKRSP